MRSRAWGAQKQATFHILPWKFGALCLVAEDTCSPGALPAIADHYRATAWEGVLLEETLRGALCKAPGAALALLVVAGPVARLAWVGGGRACRLRGRTCEVLTPAGHDGGAQVASRLFGVEAGDRFLIANSTVWRSLELWTLQAMISVSVADLPEAPQRVVARTCAEGAAAVVVSVGG